MKKIYLLFILLFSLTVEAQYLNSAFPETPYSLVGASANLHNVGTDTKSGALGYGNNPYYANFLNVTVSDYNAGSSGGRFMFWESSSATNGAIALPNDALDPDVVLVEGDDPTNAWAIVVYYSSNSMSIPGYYMSVSPFLTSYSFPPFLPPMLIQPYVPAPGYKPCINIDSDNEGNYAVVFQRNGGIESRTANYSAGVPVVPGNSTGYSNLIEPDVSIAMDGTNDIVKIVALKESRNRFVVRVREMAPIDVSSYNSLPLGGLHNPRIASPTTLSSEFSVTMNQVSGGNSNILYETFNGITPLGLKVINDGSEGLPYPTAINSTANQFPAITYHSYLGTEKLTIAWHAEFVPGSPALFNNFVGLDIDPGTRNAITSGVYLDMSYVSSSVDNVSAMALSGRYTNWCKTTAFAQGPGPFAPNELVWKYVGSFLPSWKTALSVEETIQSQEKEFNIFPNPASSELNVELKLGEKQPAQLVMTNVNGKVIYQGNVNNGLQTIDVSGLAKGVYFLSVQSQEEITTKKIVVN